MYLYIVNIDSISEKELYSFYPIINNYKKNKIDKYIKNDDKLRSIIGELLLKNILEKEYNVKYNDIIFKFNKYGKPYIYNKNIYFNISHSLNYIACVTSDKEIGIDIERIRNVNIKTISQFATANEISYIIKSKKEIYKRLFEIYTLKEAYFKMKGEDLSNLKSIEFKITDNIIKCNDNKIIMKLNYEIENYIVAICEKK